MRRPRIPFLSLLTLLLPVALLAVVLPAAPGTAGEEPPPPTLVGVALSRSTVAVTRLASEPVIISVHLRDATGVVEASDPEIPAPWPLAVLTHTSGPATGGAPPFTARDLDLTSGTAKDGFWTATMQVPSTYEGTWQVSLVVAQNSAGSVLSVDPRTRGISRALVVHATHQPSVTFGIAPSVLVGARKTLAVKGRVVDADSGSPVRGLLLTLGGGRRENCGAFGYGGSAWTRTDSRGYYAFVGLPADEGYYCVLSTLPQRQGTLDQFRITTLLRRFGEPVLQPVVTASVAHTPVRVGESVAVEGKVAAAQPLFGPQVLLQRRTRSVWRTVDTSRVRPSGRYTVSATPPGPGNWRYRVLLPGRYTIRTAVSPVVLVGAR